MIEGKTNGKLAKGGGIIEEEIVVECVYHKVRFEGRN